MKLILLSLTLFLLLSCNQKKEESSFEINRPEKVEVAKQHYLSGIFKLKTVNDTVFVMSEYYGFEATQPYLTFDTTSNIASGHSGCNGFTAPFIIENLKIQFTKPPMATEIGCEDSNTWENQFFQLLSNQPMVVDEETLTVVSDAVQLVFSK